MEELSNNVSVKKGESFKVKLEAVLPAGYRLFPPVTHCYLNYIVTIIMVRY